MAGWWPRSARSRTFSTSFAIPPPRPCSRPSPTSRARRNGWRRSPGLRRASTRLPPDVVSPIAVPPRWRVAGWTNRRSTSSAPDTGRAVTWWRADDRGAGDGRRGSADPLSGAGRSAAAHAAETCPRRRRGLARAAAGRDPGAGGGERLRQDDAGAQPAGAGTGDGRTNRLRGAGRHPFARPGVEGGAPAGGGGRGGRVPRATALALGPRVRRAGEPVSMLDVSIRAEILNLLAEL